MTAKRRKTIRWLRAARDDLAEIVEYIARDDAEAAERFSEAILSRVEILADQPGIGGVCPQARQARQLTHGKYLIYYTVHRQEVVIRAVVHGARLFRAYWLRRND